MLGVDLESGAEVIIMLRAANVGVNADNIDNRLPDMFILSPCIAWLTTNSSGILVRGTRSSLITAGGRNKHGYS